MIDKNFLIEEFNQKFCNYYNIDGFNSELNHKTPKEFNEFTNNRKIIKYFHSRIIDLRNKSKN